MYDFQVTLAVKFGWYDPNSTLPKTGFTRAAELDGPTFTITAVNEAAAEALLVPALEKAQQAIIAAATPPAPTVPTVPPAA